MLDGQGKTPMFSRVIDHVAQEKNISPMELPVLQYEFDTDALSSLDTLENTSAINSFEYSFEYAGCLVTILFDGVGDSEIEVTEYQASVQEEQTSIQENSEVQTN